MEDYSRRVGLSTILLIAILVVMGFVPAFSIAGVELKRINILSQIRDLEWGELTLFGDEPSSPEIVVLDFDESEYEVDMYHVTEAVELAYEMVAQADNDHFVPTLVEAVEESEEAECEEMSQIDTSRLLKYATLTPIEDYDTTANSAMSRLYTKLNTPNSTVRVALLGDSFVEGDILSGDLREILQSRYGGCGAGFAPVSSPLTRFRRTVATSSNGWTTHNVMQRRTTPAGLAENYYVSGWVSRPASGASTTWSGSDNRLHLDHWDGARLLFLSQNSSTVEVSVNGEPYKNYEFEGGDVVRQIMINQDDMSSFGFKVSRGADGFIGYGAIFDGGAQGGVVVDNYSVRSNNGQAMFWTNPAINAQIDHLVGGYDLVILQYGLNIMQKGVGNYTRYAEQVEKMILYVRKCFPSAAVLVMGVSDRSMKEDGTYKPMVEAPKLTAYQRNAAKNTGAAFWSTYDAMRAQGGMSNFVKEGWAGKDFTHINFAGGRQVAYALADALIFHHYTTCPPVVRVEYENIVSPENAEFKIRGFEPQVIINK